MPKYGWPDFFLSQSHAEKEGAGGFSVHIEESCIFSKLSKWDLWPVYIKLHSNKAADLN